ncbi:MAG: hypothetical protein QG581_478, partial [Patescibacteria group bacterium]|nr:hypothetical protein [Patescibacteria group bacterium]
AFFKGVDFFFELGVQLGILVDFLKGVECSGMVSSSEDYPMLENEVCSSLRMRYMAICRG